MERIGNKVSYIKKPFAKNSFVAAGLAAAALLFMPPPLAFLIIPREMRLLRQRLWVLQYYHRGVSGRLWCFRDDGEREKLSSGEDQSGGGGDPAVRVGTDDRIFVIMKWRQTHGTRSDQRAL